MVTGGFPGYKGRQRGVLAVKLLLDLEQVREQLAHFATAYNIDPALLGSVRLSKK